MAPVSSRHHHEHAKRHGGIRVGIGCIVAGGIAGTTSFLGPPGGGRPAAEHTPRGFQHQDTHRPMTTDVGFFSSSQSSTTSMVSSLGGVLSIGGCFAAGVQSMAGRVTKDTERSPPATTLKAATIGLTEEGAVNPVTKVGAIPPLGYWDPLGFCSDGNDETFRRYRSCELKHARVAMLASIGAIIQHFVRFGGCEDYPGTFEALHKVVEVDGFGWLGGFLASAGFIELFWKDDDPRYQPGDFGDPLGFANFPFCGYDTDMRNKELSNGRLAMICIAGIFAAEVATGKEAIEQFGALYGSGSAGGVFESTYNDDGIPEAFKNLNLPNVVASASGVVSEFSKVLFDAWDQ